MIISSLALWDIVNTYNMNLSQVFEVASSDLINMGVTVVSYTLKDVRDEEVRFSIALIG